MDLLQASLSRLHRAHDLLDEGGLFGNFRELVLYVLENLHWVVLAVEYLGHDLHVALGNRLLVPQLLEVGESLVDGLLLALFVATHVRLVPHLV